VFFMPVLLFVTVIVSVSLGVLAAYVAVICILNSCTEFGTEMVRCSTVCGEGRELPDRQPKAAVST